MCWPEVTNSHVITFAHVTPQRTSTTALFDYISAGRSTYCAFYHLRPHLSSDCCIGLEQFAGVSPVIAVVASFPQQTENETFLPGLTAMTKNVSLHVTSLFRLIVTCPCSLWTYHHAKVHSSFIITIINSRQADLQKEIKTKQNFLCYHHTACNTIP